ncbi:MAG: hypothetical protein ACE5MI_01390 [Acidimicrobiia bacterium]
MPALSISAPGDALLGVVAPLGLACAAGTALMVDVDQFGPRFPGSASLADLVEAGPRKADLVPQRRGVAILRNGGIGTDEAGPVLEALIAGWPAVVLRLGERAVSFGKVRNVAVHPLLPGLLLPPLGDPVVYQRTSWPVGPPGPGKVLPRPSRQAVGRLLTGREPGPSRWVSAWREVWEWA